MAEFDMSLVQRGARLRHSPYYEATQRYSPQGFTVYNHMLFPIRFESFEEEFETLLNGVTVWDVAVERCLEISGPDGARFAQLLTPRELSKCAVGQAKYVLICDGEVIHGHHLPPSLQTAEASGTVTRVSLKDAVAAYEKDLMQDALKTTRGNRAKAARLLDTTERVFNYKVRLYGIDANRFKSDAPAVRRARKSALDS